MLNAKAINTKTKPFSTSFIVITTLELISQPFSSSSFFAPDFFGEPASEHLPARPLIMSDPSNDPVR